MLCDKLPTVGLAYLPTPLEEMPRLSAALGGPRLMIKRDDRSGLSFGGNKPRIFDYVLGDALAQGADLLITPAGVQSNHLREVTAAANKLGLKSVIVVCGTPPDEAPQGNQLLFRLLGAEIHHYPHHNLHDPELLPFVDQLAERYAAQGYKPYVVHFSRRSGILGTAAHVAAAEELAAQFKALGTVPDYLVLPMGSGVTASGYVLGFKALGIKTRVVGISIILDAEQVAHDIVGYGQRAAEELGLSVRLATGDFTVHDTYIKPGYGVLSPEVTEAIRRVATTEGLLLDPTYNGKAMAAITDQIRQGAFTAGQTVVLVHTGGVPALFAQNRELMDQLQAP